MEPNPSHDYDLEVTSERHGLVVRLRGRVTAEAGRQLRDVIAAAAKCGFPVAVSLPGGRFGPADRAFATNPGGSSRDGWPARSP